MSTTKEGWVDKIKFSDFPTHRDISAKEVKKVKDILTWLIFCFPKRMYATRLMKLYYLAEIRSIEKRGKPLSTVDFVNWKHGPWSQAVAMVADTFHPDIEMNKLCGEKYKLYKAKVPKTEVDLEESEINILSELRDEWKNKTTDEVVQASKETEPFKQSNYGKIINFNIYAECLAELKSRQAQDEMNKNLAECIAGKGIMIKDKTELEKYQATS